MARADRTDTFRPDIEGLRGIAVLLVLLFHASLAGLSGGFIGVDVFFVISGFLITGLLVRERERTGRIGFRAFYARRVRRLLPAGMLALVVTLGASFLLIAPLDRASAALDAAAAALSVGNIRFALASGDYFAAVGEPSPFLHFWSLAVEEQFYLVWPALVVIAAALGGVRRGLGVALVAVIAASFAADLVVTREAVGWAFYSLPTRAWQLALGGLLAVAARPLDGVPSPLRACLGWAGLAALAAAAVAFDGSLAYPGAWALAPTVATGALIVAGTARRGPALLLTTRPLRFLGRISYSLYLWHWPILMLPAAAIDGELPPVERVALASLAVAVAWASWRFVEEPFRIGFPSLAGHPGRTILAGAAAIVLVVGGAGGLAGAASSGTWPPVQIASALEGGPVATPVGGSDSGGDGTASEAAAVNGSPSGVSQPRAAGLGEPFRGLEVVGVTPSGSPGAGSGSPTAGTGGPTSAPAPTPAPTPAAQPYIALPADVRPSLAAARGDEERLRADGCLAFEPDTVPRDCVYGDPSSSFTVALVGDSHAAQWFPALEQVALRHDWRVLTFVKVACPFLDIPVIDILLKRQYDECRTYDEATIARLQALRPDLTVVSMSRYAIHPVRAGDATIAAQAASFARMLERIPGRVAVIVDTPDGGRDIPACLSWHPDDVRLCAVPRSVAFADNLGAIERAATAATGDALIDLTSRVCRGDPCPVVVDDMIVFRDMRHLTATFARSLAPDLDRALARILAPPPIPVPSPTTTPIRPTEPTQPTAPSAPTPSPSSPATGSLTARSTPAGPGAS